MFAAGRAIDRPVEYGVFAVDDANNRVNGLLPTDRDYLKAVRQRAIVLFNTTANNSANAQYSGQFLSSQSTIRQD